MSAILENAAGGLIASEVHGVIGWMLSRIRAEIQLAWGFKKELEELERQFTKLNGLLHGANSWVTNPLMADWLKKIKDAAFDVDIFLDELSYNAHEHKGRQTRKRDKFMEAVSKPFRHNIMAHKVRDLRKLIASIYSEANELGIKTIQVAAGQVYSGIHRREIEKRDKKLFDQRQSVDLQLFRGRDEDADELAKLLCNPNNTNLHLTVIGIVGMAGLGKTTLSKRISKVPVVKTFFDDMVMWLVVSYDYNSLDLLLKQMVEILFKKASKVEQREALIEKLKTEMKGKKYLIILDDVWDTIHPCWESLKSILYEIGVSRGTTLLVTSRDQKVVEKLKTPERPTIYELKRLSPDDSWSLFTAKYYDGIGEKEDLAKRMMDKCGGVPLAIRVLADLLRDKSIQDWREIEKSEIWKQVDDPNGILPSLRLSYQYLPDRALKKCFAYCAIFKEDEVIQVKHLIHMWMAQGFLQHDDQMERTGMYYIEQLLSCSLFQEAKMDKDGSIKTFKMHDLVWTLARDVSMGECLCLSLQKDVLTSDVRHVSIHSDIKTTEFTSKSCTKLQTCRLGKGDVHFWLTCKHLRVLDVGRQKCGRINWKPLRSLIHLRYFAVIVDDYFHTALTQCNLGDHITKLYHLQTVSVSTFGVFDRENKVKTFFQVVFGNLVNINHIILPNDIKIGIPVGLSKLTALQTLPVINLGLNWGGRRSDLGVLTNLRGTLQICCLSLLTVEEACSLNLGSKSNLDSLVLAWASNSQNPSSIYFTELEKPLKKNPNADEILEALQPNSNLDKLELCMFDGTKFPRWLMAPGLALNNIVSLRIWHCREADGNLELGNFRCLRILDVQFCKKLTITCPKDNKSQCCEFLLEDLKIVECYKVEGRLLMPKLQRIKIKGNNSTSSDVLVGLGDLPYLRKLCTDLQLPVDLREDSPVFTSLKDVTLYYCRDGTTLPRWLMGPGSPLNNIVSLIIWYGEGADGNLKVDNFPYLRILRVSCCKNLTITFPNNMYQHLEEVKIVDCEKVELEDQLLLPKLQKIEIKGNNSTSRDVLVGLGSLPHLRELETDLQLPVDLGEHSPVCKSLERLTINGSKYKNNNGDTTDLPHQLQHLVALQILRFEYFESVEVIPNWLAKLTSLRFLYLSHMPKLKQLPPQDVMQSLSKSTSLFCTFCPILEEDLRNKGEEWSKISHIGSIYPK